MREGNTNTPWDETHCRPHTSIDGCLACSTGCKIMIGHRFKCLIRKKVSIKKIRDFRLLSTEKLKVGT